MRECAWYFCLCVVLLFVGSPALLAGTYTVEDGGQDGDGGGGGYGWGAQAHAWADADGSRPYSWGYAWGQKVLYATEGAWYWVSSSCNATAYGCYTDYEGSAAQGSGGASADTMGCTASASAGKASNGIVGSDDDYDHDPGGSDYEYLYLDEFGSITASCGAGAAGVVPERSPNYGNGTGDAFADIG